MYDPGNVQKPRRTRSESVHLFIYFLKYQQAYLKATAITEIKGLKTSDYYDVVRRIRTRVKLIISYLFQP